MEKISYLEMCKIFSQHNGENNITQQFADKNPVFGCVVYKSSNWPDKDYSLECRSYRVRSDNKMFIARMGGNSIFADSLDGSDIGVRLDWQDWEVDYCYIMD